MVANAKLFQEAMFFINIFTMDLVFKRFKNEWTLDVKVGLIIYLEIVAIWSPLSSFASKSMFPRCKMTATSFQILSTAKSANSSALKALCTTLNSEA